MITKPQSIAIGPDVAQRAFSEFFVRNFGASYTHIPAYNQIIDYLADSQGRSLLLMGGCGTGKTSILKLIQIIIRQKFQILTTIYNTNDFMQDIKCGKTGNIVKYYDHIMQSKYICLDELGKEPQIHIFGNKIDVIYSIMNNVDLGKKIVFATTNLSKEELTKVYDQRVIDRIRGNFTIIEFIGNSMRK